MGCSVTSLAEMQNIVRSCTFTQQVELFDATCLFVARALYSILDCHQMGKFYLLEDSTEKLASFLDVFSVLGILKTKFQAVAKGTLPWCYKGGRNSECRLFYDLMATKHMNFRCNISHLWVR